MPRVREDVPLILSDLRGGMNDADPPLSLSDQQCVDALNVDWDEGTLAHKRAGSSLITMTFSSGGPFTGTISTVLRHVPGADETAAELWAFDNAATPIVGRLAAATQFVAPTMVDAISGTTYEIYGLSFADKLFLAYDSTQNRLHVWDGTRVRRVGLATPNPPTVATLGGSGKTFTRHYRIRTADISGSIAVRRSEASTSVSLSITDDSGIQVTRPTLPTNEHETHWEVEYADASTGPWYRASQVATGTSTYDDTAATIVTTNLTDRDGLHYPPPSARYLSRDQARILMAGAWETSGGYTTPNIRRVWWTSPTGSRAASTTDEAETIPLTTTAAVEYGIDVEQAITGLGGPVDGDTYVFAYRAIWGLTPTGLPGAAAYRRYTAREDIGCIHAKTIVKAEDENGLPALYFLSHKGPYRIGVNGIQYCGNDIEARWSTVNLGATTIVGHGVAHPDKHQVWWWVSVSSENEPTTTKIVFDTRLGRASMGDGESSILRGWSRANGEQAKARCSCLFSNTIGATMSRDLKPFIGQNGAANRIWKCDTGTDDNGTAFQAYVETKPFMPGGFGMNHAIRDGQLVAKVATGVTITMTPVSDFGLEEVQVGTALLTAAASETRIQKRVEGLQASGKGAIALRIGDASAVSNAWTLDAALANVTIQEPRS